MSTFGSVFRVTTAGESHCLSVNCIVDGCPPGMTLTEADVQPQLTRRRPGQSAISTPRDEKDKVQIHSGTEFGITLGTPIAMRVMNENQRPHDYKGDNMDLFPRPSHADFTYIEKYGVKASSGGGRSSARETIGRVAAGAIAEKILKQSYGVEIVAFVSSVGPEFLFPPSAKYPTPAANPEFLKLIETITREEVDAFLPIRCPSKDGNDRMNKIAEHYRDRHDSIGGIITCVIRNVPSGLGEPVFDKMEAKLAHAMLSIPATKGFSIGSGFGGCQIPGTIHNDPFVKAEGQEKLMTKSNNSGGIQGGITNGAPIYFDVAFKPPATIGAAQSTAGYDLLDGVLEAKGRHDPCVVPRAIPIVESMAALAVCDALMIQHARNGARSMLPLVKHALPTGKAKIVGGPGLTAETSGTNGLVKEVNGTNGVNGTH